MLQSKTLAFLTDLKANNSKAWFDQNRKTYEAARADFLALVGQVIQGLSTQDPAIGRTPLDPKKCVFRINRDTRFSTNKDPYKTNFGAWFNTGGKALNAAGYYLNLEPGNCFLAGGSYMPEPDKLAVIRQEIDYNLADFQQLLTAPSFTRYFDGLNRDDALQRPPKGYAADNPAIEYLKLKSFTAWHRLPDETFTKPNIVDYTLTVFAGLQPLVTFLNHSLVPD